MKRCSVLIAILLTGCLPEAIIDPATCKVDPVLEGTWLAKGQDLEQCMHDDVEYGPGAQHSTYLVKAFDERCYLITALDYYLAKDGRLGIFGLGGGGALSQWRAWLAPIGELYPGAPAAHLEAPPRPTSRESTQLSSGSWLASTSAAEPPTADLRSSKELI